MVEYVNNALSSIRTENSNFAQIAKGFSHFNHDMNKTIRQIDSRLIEIWKMKSNLVMLLQKIIKHYYYFPNAFNFFREKLQQLIIDDVHFACRSNFIPQAIIDEAHLAEHLFKLSVNIQASGFRFLFPLSDIAAYYSIPIASCRFTKHKVFVTVKIPLIEINESFQMSKLVNLPFMMLSNDTKLTCRLNNIFTYFIADSKKNLFFLSNDIHDTCDISGSGLCLKPKFIPPHFSNENCLTKIYQGDSIENLKLFCSYTCISSSEQWIYKLPTSEVVLLYPKLPLSIHCSDKTEDTQITEYDPFGHLVIQLPCQCHLRLADTTILPHFPCESKFTGLTS